MFALERKSKHQFGAQKAVNTKYFELKRPCANCPFRNDAQAIGLAAGRLDQIKRDLLSDDHSSFDCHKSVYRKNSTVQKPKDQRKMCAGAASFLMEQGRPTVSMRLAFSLGLMTPNHWQTPKTK